MAKVGGLFKLDAICAKLKINLQAPSLEQGHCINGEICNVKVKHEEPNNNESSLIPPKEATDANGLCQIEPSSRKSRRKAPKPRSIIDINAADQAKEDLSEYEENNQDVDFDSICEAAMEEEEQGEDVSCDDVPEVNRHASGDASFNDSVSFEVLDLSIIKHKVCEEADDPPQENGVLNLSTRNRKVPDCEDVSIIKPVADEVEMKDYAENTMHELLSMYGLDDSAQSISSKIPLKNFDSGSILSRTPLVVKKPCKMPNTTSTPHPIHLLTGLNSSVKTELIDDNSLAASDYSSLDGQFSLGESYLSSAKQSLITADHQGPLSPGSRTADYYQYFKRFGSYEGCGGNHCEDMGYREHFHCMDCSFRVFVKREEMIRHFKWHKKRDDSLQHGFMRYSPVDDCKFSCSFNGKQTHYHCIQLGCSKVYISTSDVQMHANYHRKDSLIVRQGFQRFRATEDCGSQDCSFYDQRTTHFHCTRTGCSFTFKNKADMEKHKTYHQKDEILSRDGFKKFMKYEHCNYASCRYSKANNHIHCIRPGCQYVLHSTGQLYSHKRKHERSDIEHAYRRYKGDPTKSSSMTLPHQISVMSESGKNASSKREYVELDNLVKMDRSKSMNISDTSSISSEVQDLSMLSEPPTPEYKYTSIIKHEPIDDSYNEKVPPSTIAKLVCKLTNPSQLNMSGVVHASDDYTNSTSEQISRSVSPTMGICPGGFVPKVSPPVNEKKERDESWKKYLTRYTANDPCHSRCQFLYKDHYHCNILNCGMLFRSKDGVREHAKFHEQQDRITSLTFMAYEENMKCTDGCRYSQKEKHFHCLWVDCKHVISAVADPVFSRMEHYKIHEYSRASMGRKMSSSPCMTIRTPDSFKRRRGRPPKYPKNEIPQVPKLVLTEEEISEQARKLGPGHCISSGFKKYSLSDPCPDDKCMFLMKDHYHCVRAQCHHATDRHDVLNLHAKDFHSYIRINEGFEFFDRTVNCRRPHCHNNRANRHFHCVRPRCDYSFVRVSTMAQHEKKHLMAESGLTLSPTIGVPKMALMSSSNLSKAPNEALTQTSTASPVSGAFYPIPSSQHVVMSAGLVQVTNTAPIMVTMPRGKETHVVNSSSIMLAPISMAQIANLSNSQIMTSFPAPILVAPGTKILTSAPSARAATASTSSNGRTSNKGQLMFSASTPQLVQIAPKPLVARPTVPGNQGLPLTMLLQQKGPKIMPQPSWVSLLVKMHCGPHQNCGRPFCKLKKKDHFHCFDCTQAFSDPLRLKSHIVKHGFNVDKLNTVQGRTLPLAASEPVQHTENARGDELSNSDDDVDSSLNLIPGSFSNILTKSLDQDTTNGIRSEAMDLTRSNTITNIPRTPSTDTVAVTQASTAAVTQASTVAVTQASTIAVTQASTVAVTQASTVTQAPTDTVAVTHAMTDEQEAEETDIALLQTLGLRKKNSNNENFEKPSRRSRRKRTIPKNVDYVDSESAVSMSKIRRVGSPRTTVLNPKVTLPVETKHDTTINKDLMKDNDNISNTEIKPDEKVDISLPDDSPKELPPVKEITQMPDAGSEKENYAKFKFNEDCHFDRCAYRLSQLHFHCTLKDCGYSFGDKSRYPQHEHRHKVITEMMGGEFEEFRSNIDCGRQDCQFARKSTHFHCLKCLFICIETVKVTAHRRQHSKDAVKT